MNTVTHPCSRCSGSGQLSGFSHVVGGVCFKCGGGGKQSGKPSTPAQSWRVSAVLIETGVRIVVFTVKAKTRLKALQIATMKINGHNYDRNSVEVEAA